MTTTDSGPRPTVLEVLLRAAWIAVQLTAVLYLGQQGALFFYQGF
jgi:hypothetical protein